MFLHLMPDEKIINRTIHFFELAYPGQNHYIILLPKYSEKCLNVDPTSCPNINVMNISSDEINRYIVNSSVYSSIIVHYLSLDSAIFVNKVTHSNIYWIEWGGDMYNSFLRRKGFKLYYDEKIVAHLNHPHIPFFIQKLFRFIRETGSFKVRYNAVKKIKYFVPDSMEDEYSLFLKYYPEFSHLRYRNFFYYPIQQIVGDSNLDKRVVGNNIFIGNSASETNNHVEIFDLIKDKINDLKVYAPLSYGSTAAYVSYILQKGYELLGTNFEPIIQFMPLAKYNEMFYSASHFIYGNYRQEAVGNILYAFYIGGKVYLHKSNPLYSFYKRLGLVLFAIEDIDADSFTQSLNDMQYYNNKGIIEETYSNDRLLDLIKSSFLND